MLPRSTVLYMVAACGGVPISDLLDRASQHSDIMHSLSTTLTQDLVSTCTARNYCELSEVYKSLKFMTIKD